MRFLAGVDLLAGHPSWAAAKVLLALLLEDIRQPTAERGLVGALARSPNMTLVDALVRGVQEETEPTRLALIAEILGWRRQVEAIPRLRELAEHGSLPLRRAAITALGRIGDRDAVEIIFPALEQPELAEVGSTALLLLGEWRGVDFFAQSLARNERWLTQSPGEIVGRHGGPAYFLLLMRTSDQEGPGGIGSLAGLGLLGNVRAVPKLIEAVGSRNPVRQAVANTALEVITGHREDLEDAHPRQRWLEWWEEHGPDFEERARYREGQPLTIRGLVARLGHDDLAARQAAYDELVIATGESLPFDADGPWRVQLAHRAAWERWWADNAHDLPASGWCFHGGEL
jgi:HEAT repeat protein